MAKQFLYRGKTLGELKLMSPQEFVKIVPSKERRKLKRGLSHAEKKLISKIRPGGKPPRTHRRELVITPELVGSTVLVYMGKGFQRVDILPEMLGHRLGEYAPTRTKVKHSAPSMGATRNSKFVALK